MAVIKVRLLLYVVKIEGNFPLNTSGPQTKLSKVMLDKSRRVKAPSIKSLHNRIGVKDNANVVIFNCNLK